MSSKPLKCNKGCGTTIHFDDRHLSQSGKKIPLEEDGEPHQCPNSDYSKNKGPGRSSYQDSNTDLVFEAIKVELNNMKIKLDSMEIKIDRALHLMQGQNTLEGSD